MSERENATTMWDDVPQADGQSVKMAPKIGPRLTVVQQVYHQRPDMSPSQYEHRWDVILEIDEQPYYRERTLQPDEEHSIDCGWIEKPGTLLIENQEGLFTGKNPTPEEREDVAGRVLHLSIADSFEIVIRPGDCQRLCLNPENPSLNQLMIAHLSDSPVRYAITVFSR